LAGFWTEPGSGDANIEEVLAAAGPDFEGWVVTEVDRGTTTAEGSIMGCGTSLSSVLPMHPQVPETPVFGAFGIDSPLAEKPRLLPDLCKQKN
jgi:hypothetical protein